jgi:hypothetical protein
VEDKLFIHLYYILVEKYFSFINHVLECFFPMNHHQNVIQFNKIHKSLFQINVHFWGKYIFNCVCDLNYYKNQIYFFPFGQISIKYEILKLVFMQYSKSSIG